MDRKIKRLVDRVKAHLHEKYGESIKRVETFLHTAEYVFSIGDYGVDRRVTREEGEDLLEAAQDFVGKVKDYLDR